VRTAVQGHQGDGCDGHAHDHAAIEHDHGAEFRHFGEARDTTKITPGECLFSLRPHTAAG